MDSETITFFRVQYRHVYFNLGVNTRTSSWFDLLDWNDVQPLEYETVEEARNYIADRSGITDTTQYRVVRLVTTITEVSAL